MKINFQDYDFTEFIVKEEEFCGIPAKLIIPNHIGCAFNQKNKVFRSSIWDLEGNLLSASMPKFMNYGQSPEHFPVPQNLDNTNIVCKIDGSTCIFDFVNDKVSMRTRGCFSYLSQSNFKDFDYCLEKYNKIIDWIKSNNHYSLICEIVSPNQQIIIKYPEPDLYLISAINKDDYSLAKQSTLDVIGQQILVKRPKYYQFPSIPELIENIEEDKFIEGIVLYSSEDQVLHKIKALRYLYLHRLKSELSSFDKILDLFLLSKRPDFKTFYDYLEKTFDIELARQVEPDLLKICKLDFAAKNILVEMEEFSNNLVGLNRKDAALRILEKYRPLQLDSFCFTIYSKKLIDDKVYKKLIYNIIEHEQK